jgi:hypothetical protein
MMRGNMREFIVDFITIITIIIVVYAGLILLSEIF